MRNPPVVAILGSTGLVGNEIVSLLDSRRVKCKEVKLYASQESVGEVYKIGDEEGVVSLLTRDALKGGIDVAFLALPPQLAKEYLEYAITEDVIVIDTTAASRENLTALVVPEINQEALYRGEKIFSVPSSCAISLALILSRLSRLSPIKRVVVSTYQAASGAGKHAVDELWEQTRSVFTQKEIPTEQFEFQLAFNTVPKVGTITASGSSTEEESIVREVRALLGEPNLPLAVSTARVPVFYGDGLSIAVELEKEVFPAEFQDALAREDLFAVSADPQDLPLHIDAAGRDEILVGRIRKDTSVSHGLLFWAVTDNIRRGTALTAVRILEALATPQQ